MHIGVDLLWVRPGICGGTESYIRNLLDGFAQYDTENKYTLFVATDNAETFRHYEKNGNMILKICTVACARQWKRILWENLYLDKWARRENVDAMFIPVYSKPRSNGKIPYVTVIHDLQALHYPEYFSFGRRMFLKYAWRYACNSSALVVTISNYCKEDLIKYYPKVKEKIKTIYNPILLSEKSADFELVAEKYKLLKNNYFYCVSSMLPHKNLDTILKVMAEWQGDEKLVISGVGGNLDEVTETIKRYRIKDKVVLTGFVSNEERNALYDNCSLFLFPSVFEGFGMPAVEAMSKGKRVVMTDKSCLKEVTMGKAIYVEEPFSVESWKERMIYALDLPENVISFDRYQIENVVKQYCEIW